MNKTISIFFLAVFLTAGMFVINANAQPEAALDPAAVSTLQQMAKYLTGLQSMRFQAEVEYDAVQGDGQSIEFGATREISLRRPERLRVDATGRGGAERSLFYDGKQVALIDRTNGVYATAEQTGDIDAILGFIEEKLHLQIPLHELVSNQLGEKLTSEIVFAAVVGEEFIDGVRCDHLALRKKDRGIQVWIEQGDKPLLHRIVITYEKAPGQPQFRAIFSKWDVSPQLEDSLFEFIPPKGSEKIIFESAADIASGAKEAV